MDQIFLFFVLAGGLAALLSSIGVWAPRKLWVKGAALATMALFLPVTYASLSDLLSRPKPIAFEWTQLDIEEANVLGARMEEDKAIYLWLALDGVAEPRSYVLPWNEEMAKQLHSAQRKAEAEGAAVRMNQPFERSWDDRERKFYAAPPPPPAAKDHTPSQPEIFQKTGLQGAAEPEASPAVFD